MLLRFTQIFIKCEVKPRMITTFLLLKQWRYFDFKQFLITIQDQWKNQKIEDKKFDIGL